MVRKVGRLAKRIVCLCASEIQGIELAVVRSWPQTPLGNIIRSAYYKNKCKAFGKQVLISEQVFIYDYDNLEIGSGVSISAKSMLSASGGLKIADHVFIGPGTYVWTVNHDYHVADIFSEEQYIFKGVSIGSNVWIAAGVRIVPGVTIGEGAVVGMGSVVTKDVPPHVLVAGAPAKIIKQIRRGDHVLEKT